MSMTPKNAALLVCTALLVIIMLQNTQVVSFKVLFWELSMSRIILLPLILVCGVIIGIIIGKRA